MNYHNVVFTVQMAGRTEAETSFSCTVSLDEATAAVNAWNKEQKFTPKELWNTWAFFGRSSAEPTPGYYTVSLTNQLVPYFQALVERKELDKRIDTLLNEQEGA